MRLLNNLWRALSLAAALAVGAACLAGCGGGDAGESADGDSGVRLGTFSDTRDGQIYGAVKIGGQTWMAENLNVAAGNSWCYGDDTSNCGRYGRLYDWETAMAACPAGWHLPSRQEWDSLVVRAGGVEVAGKKLKSKRGWNRDDMSGVSGNGTDDYGFSALPGGDRRYPVGGFGNVGDFGGWWAAERDGGNAYYWYIYNIMGDAREYYYGKGYGLSVRCVKDATGSVGFSGAQTAP
jgi:uncharacterized protein (TIGR02145 family)